MDRFGSSHFALWAETDDRRLLDLVRPYDIQWSAHTAAAWGELDELRSSAAGNRQMLTTNQGRGTPLHWAAYYGQMISAQWLVAQNIDLPATEGRGYIRCATFGGSDEIIRLLVAHGALVDYLNPGGGAPQTALQHQCKHGRTVGVATLLAVGADPNLPQPTDGRTAVHLAAATGVAGKLLRMLLAAAGDPQQEDHAGLTAYDWADRANRRTSARTLREWTG